ncbi:MAG: hypothetical protein KAR24_03390, partial [Candidatus Pacebacteria bacterium]|nr:hypothetical protein [Candidatus Paceibacterota bacterium]
FGSVYMMKSELFLNNNREAIECNRAERVVTPTYNIRSEPVVTHRTSIKPRSLASIKNRKVLCVFFFFSPPQQICEKEKILSVFAYFFNGSTC